jgi:hypothetical protein
MRPGFLAETQFGVRSTVENVSASSSTSSSLLPISPWRHTSGRPAGARLKAIESVSPSRARSGHKEWGVLIVFSFLRFPQT